KRRFTAKTTKKARDREQFRRARNLPFLVFSRFFLCVLSDSVALFAVKSLSILHVYFNPNMQSTHPEVYASPELARDLGASHATAVVVGTIIGSGIFLVPAEMMQAAGTANLVYLAWLVGGLLSFFGALTYAELGAMKPQAGGEYVYVRDAYGPLGGFLYAWTWFVIAKPGSIATITTGLVRILGTFSIFSFFAHDIVSRPFHVSWAQLVAIAATVLISLLNYIGIKKAGEFQLVFTILKVAMILAIV